jgi:hypothetical protein
MAVAHKPPVSEGGAVAGTYNAQARSPSDIPLLDMSANLTAGALFNVSGIVAVITGGGSGI